MRWVDEDMTIPTTFQRGFTLVEAVMVIAITGIVAGMVAVFIQRPVQAYFDASRRAELTDTADTALRRMTRDLQGALPNSVRVTGDFIEFIPVLGAGRYCADVGTAATWASTACTNALDFTVAATAFSILGPIPPLAPGNAIVVYNLGLPGADVYAGDNRTAFNSLAGSVVTMAAKQFPAGSPGQRFQVVGTAVSYRCDLGNGQLLRYANYPIQAVQPTPPGVPATVATLARGVSACSFTYTPGFLQDTGIVVIGLTVRQWDAVGQTWEAVSLWHQVNVSNTP